MKGRSGEKIRIEIRHEEGPLIVPQRANRNQDFDMIMGRRRRRAAAERRKRGASFLQGGELAIKPLDRRHWEFPERKAHP